MAKNQNKYKLFERFLSVALCTDAIAFILYMIFISCCVIGDVHEMLLEMVWVGISSYFSTERMCIVRNDF